MNRKGFLDILILLLPIIFCILMIFMSMGDTKREKEAISRGYATYNAEGKFVWKEQQK